MSKKISILGSRGIPAGHGGFETFAEHLALYLASKGWTVKVYCQDNGRRPLYEEVWNNVHLVHISMASQNALGTIVFDWKSTLHACRHDNFVLTLGYNTAVFCLLYRFRKIINLINMDGLEWKRKKWNLAERLWLYINEQAACRLGNHLIADHPEIKAHLERLVKESKITCIPYGADRVIRTNPDVVRQYGLQPEEYSIVIARPEPENSILEIVQAFSKKRRNHKLLVIGNYQPDKSDYQHKILSSASEEVLFPGAIYDKKALDSLRYYARIYIHGHTVGGTNPSLVEAMAAGLPVLAHDNKFNRWVGGSQARFFGSSQECAAELDNLLENHNQLRAMRAASLKRYEELFTWEKILTSYEDLLNRWNPNNKAEEHAEAFSGP